MINLSELNDKQLEAVKETEGYVRVIAGAGSGKTKLLVNRYAYLVMEYGIDPYNILCVTFTNKAAREMKSRIEKIIGNQFDTNLICTYHGFCARLLRDESEKLFLTKNFQILDNYQQKEILDEIYQKYELKFDYASFESIIKKITLYKLMHPEYVSKMIDSNPVQILSDKNNMDDNIIEDYLQKEKLIHGLDFNDLIHFALYLLKHNEELRLEWQNRLNYILVDEFQDSSKTEMELIEILSNNYRNLMIVGDPDQNIYEWRGSDVKLLVDFDKEHAPTKTIILDRNYRSTPEILKCANTLIDKNVLRLKKDLYTLNSNVAEVIHYHLKDEDKQNDYIYKEIKTLKNKYNYSYSDIAILYRSSFLSRIIEKGLVNNNVPYTIYGGVKFYQRMEVLDALAYLKLLCFGDDVSFKRIINVPRRKMGKKKIDYLSRIQDKENKSLYNILKEHIDDDIFSKTDAYDFVNLIENLRDRIKELKLSDIVSEVITKSGYDSYLRELGDEERLDNIIEFKRTTSEFERVYGEDYPLNDYLREVSIQSKDDDDDEKEQVKLMTIHSSKGLEFKAVFVVGLNEGIFPSSKTLEERKELGLEEERRLCYVAITRAMEHLYLFDTEGQSARGMNNLPSRFLFEVGENNYQRYGTISSSLMKQYKDYVNKHSFEQFESNYEIGNIINHHIFGQGEILDIDKKRNSYIVKFDKFNLPRNISKKYFEPKETTSQHLIEEPKVEVIENPIIDYNDYDCNDEMTYYGNIYSSEAYAKENNINYEETDNIFVEYVDDGDASGDSYAKVPIPIMPDMTDNKVIEKVNVKHKFIDEGNLWDNLDVPKTDWRCIDVYDLGAPIGICEMCGKNIIRYVHVMKHNFYHDLHVGCVCAGKMQGDPENAKKLEKELRNKEKRRENFMRKEWSISSRGNEYKKIKNRIIVLFYDNKTNKVTYSIDGRYSKKWFDTRNEALNAIFDIISSY